MLSIKKQKMLEHSEIQEIVEKQIKPITKEIKSWNYSSIEVEQILGIYEMRAEYFEINRGFKPFVTVMPIEIFTVSGTIK
jgi:hypothetical protein